MKWNNNRQNRTLIFFNHKTNIMTAEIIVFVYKRKKQYKVLDLDVAKREHTELINNK